MIYQGWCRPKSGGPWRKIEGAKADTFAALYEMLMDRCELAGCAEPADYLILPEGMLPSARDHRQYDTRRMLPG